MFQSDIDTILNGIKGRFTFGVMDVLRRTITQIHKKIQFNIYFPPENSFS